MSTEIVVVTIDNHGNASVNNDPLNVTRPTRIVWQLDPCSQPNWKLEYIVPRPGSPNMKNQLVQWSKVPEHAMISALNVCTATGNIKYDVLYRSRKPGSQLEVYDPMIENRPPLLGRKKKAGDEVCIPVDITDDGTVTEPGKNDILVVQGAKAPGKNYKVKIRWELTTQAQETWELVDVAWRAPGPPEGEFFDKTKSTSSKGCGWIRVKDRNDTPGSFRYAIIYKRKSGSELFVFDPLIENVPPKLTK